MPPCEHRRARRSTPSGAARVRITSRPRRCPRSPLLGAAAVRALFMRCRASTTWRWRPRDAVVAFFVVLGRVSRAELATPCSPPLEMSTRREPSPTWPRPRGRDPGQYESHAVPRHVRTNSGAPGRSVRPSPPAESRTKERPRRACAVPECHPRDAPLRLRLGGLDNLLRRRRGLDWRARPRTRGR